MYILSELYNFYAFTAVEKHNEYENKIVLNELNYLKENKLGTTDPCTCNLCHKYILYLFVCLFVNGNNSI